MHSDPNAEARFKKLGAAYATLFQNNRKREAEQVNRPSQGGAIHRVDLIRHPVTTEIPPTNPHLPASTTLPTAPWPNDDAPRRRYRLPRRPPGRRRPPRSRSRRRRRKRRPPPSSALPEPHELRRGRLRSLGRGEAPRVSPRRRGSSSNLRGPACRARGRRREGRPRGRLRQRCLGRRRRAAGAAHSTSKSGAATLLKPPPL